MYKLKKFRYPRIYEYMLMDNNGIINTQVNCNVITIQFCFMIYKIVGEMIIFNFDGYTTKVYNGCISKSIMDRYYTNFAYFPKRHTHAIIKKNKYLIKFKYFSNNRITLMKFDKYKTIYTLIHHFEVISNLLYLTLYNNHTNMIDIDAPFHKKHYFMGKKHIYNV